MAQDGRSHADVFGRGDPGHEGGASRDAESGTTLIARER